MISENHNFYCPDCALAELSIDFNSSTNESNTTEQMITEAE